MSRSIHKTVKSVFGGKSAREMDQKIRNNDPDVEDLGKKYAYKNSKRYKRQLEKQLKHSINEQ